LLAGDFGLWHRSFLDREERFARFPIEQEKVPDFRDLRQGIQLPAVAFDRHEVWRTRDVIVPQVMMHDLEMPDALARGGLKREHAIGEEVCADAIAAPMIVGSRAGAGKHQAALRVQRHPAPAIGATDSFPRVGGPGLVPELARVRNGVENPATFPGARVKGADVARRSGIGTFSNH